MAGLVGELNHYQILKVSPIASEDEIREAFHREAVQFHPDQYLSQNNQKLQELSKKIYARVTEAYEVLSDPEKRSEYDLEQSGNVEPVDEDAITSVRRKPDWAAKSPGDKFYKLAEKAYQGGDLRSALMNIQIAIGADSDNSRFLNFKDRVEAQLAKKSK